MTLVFTQWLGSKASHLQHLLPLIPMGECYVEPFGGGGSVLLNRPKSDVEIYNDLDHGLVEMFHCVRDPEMFELFQRYVLLTPYSREEFVRAIAWEDEVDPVRRAVGFYIMLNQRMGGVRKTYAGNWARSKTINMAEGYFKRVEGLGDVHQRLKGVQIECKDALDLIQEMDSRDTVFYLDPPYTMDSRRGKQKEYHVDADDDFQLRMLDVIAAARGMVVMSGYESPLYSPLEEMGWVKDGWTVVDKGGTKKVGGSRREVVWRNPAASKHGVMVPLTGLVEALFSDSQLKGG